jgi:hypothetical protein
MVLYAMMHAYGLAIKRLLSKASFSALHPNGLFDAFLPLFGTAPEECMDYP